MLRSLLTICWLLLVWVSVACPGLCCSGLCCLSGSFGSVCVCDWHCSAWVFVWLAVSVYFSMFLWSLVHFRYVLFVWQILIGVNVHVRFRWHVRLLLIISLFSCNVINIYYCGLQMIYNYAWEYKWQKMFIVPFLVTIFSVIASPLQTHPNKGPGGLQCLSYCNWLWRVQPVSNGIATALDTFRQFGDGVQVWRVTRNFLYLEQPTWSTLSSPAGYKLLLLFSLTIRIYTVNIIKHFLLPQKIAVYCLQTSTRASGFLCTTVPLPRLSEFK